MQSDMNVVNDCKHTELHGSGCFHIISVLHFLGFFVAYSGISEHFLVLF